MAVEGSLDLFSLPEILQMISQQGKTGILTVQGQQDIVAVSFLQGRIVAADSLAHTVEEGLSKVLVSEGILGAADFARANSENQAGGGRLIDFLVERRYLTREQLLAALRLQTLRQLESLVRWREGDFKFYGGDEVSYEEGFEPIAVEDFLLRMLVEYGPPQPSQAAPPPQPPQPAPRPPAPQPITLPPALPTAAARTAGAAAAAAALTATAATAATVPTAATSIAPPRTTGGGRAQLPAFPMLPDLPELPMPEPLPALDIAAAETEPWARPAAGLAGVAGMAGVNPAATPSASASAGNADATGGIGQPGAASLASSSSAAGEPVPWPAAVFATPASAAPAKPPRGTAGNAGGPGGGRATGARSSGVAALPAAGTAGTAATFGGAAFAPLAAGGAGVAAPSSEGEAFEPLLPPPGAALLPSKKFRQMQIERPTVTLGTRLAAAALAALAAGLLIAGVRRAPQGPLLPFAWERSVRGSFERNQREALFAKIDVAAKTAFLRDGRFPDALAQLADSGLLAPGDLYDPHGGLLQYSTREDSYSLQAPESSLRGAGEGDRADHDERNDHNERNRAEGAISESIAGNYLLDPGVLRTAPSTITPIVLLD